MNPRALIIFSKEPKPARVKTRMIPPLSPEAAAELSLCFIRDALKAALKVKEVERYLFFAPERARAFYEEIAPRGFNLIPQQGENLTERCAHSIIEAFERGHTQMVQMGTDTPQTAPEDIEAAFAVLDDHDMGIGPARDGGYYLLSLAQPAVGIYDKVVMGRETVFDEMMANAARLGLSVRTLPEWTDADTYEDLLSLRRDPAITLGRHTRKFLSLNDPES
jgi:hypothetical protein